MANIMSLKSIRNKPSRNGFDLSFKKNFTAKAGELLPVMVKEVLPGDTFKINLKAFTRTQPVNTAAFARIREYYDFFFVPYDLLWNKSSTVLTQMYDNPQHAVSLDPTQNYVLNGEMPYSTSQSIADYIYSLSTDTIASDYSSNYMGYSRAKCAVKLLEYLGYGNYESFLSSPWSTSPLMADLNHNLFGLLAYQKIYSDFYRDSQWERISPSTFNVDYLDGQNMYLTNFYNNKPFIESYNLFDLRYCNWQKDLFHGVLPHQQYGETAVASITPNVTGKLTLANFTTVGTSPATASGTATKSLPAFDTVGDLSILVLRQAEFLQKWKEITQSCNKDSKDQLEKHWGVSIGDGFSELCTYLGGVSSSIDINEVVNTNITGSAAADIAGKGVGVVNGEINFNSVGRYGLIMCIYHCLPLLDYTTDMLDPAFLKVNSTDYAIPEFDRVGMQSMPLIQLMNPLRSVANASGLVLGYVPRYVDYKTSVDQSVGGFKRTLNSWVISYGNESVKNQVVLPFSAPPVEPFDPVPSVSPMNFTFFKVNPNCLDPIFAVKVDSDMSTDQFLCSSFFDVKAVRNLDTDGLPY
nr:MAG TPA: Major capsid protein [Microviridae sp.]